MDEKLAYYTDICGLVNLKLMKTVNDDTVDDPKPKRIKESKDLRPNTKRKIQNPPKDDIDEDAGPTTPKQKFRRQNDSKGEEDNNNSDRASFKKRKFDERNDSNSFQKNDRKFSKGDKFEKGGRFDKGKKFDKGGKFDKSGKPGKRFNRQ